MRGGSFRSGTSARVAEPIPGRAQQRQAQDAVLAVPIDSCPAQCLAGDSAAERGDAGQVHPAVPALRAVIALSARSVELTVAERFPLCVGSDCALLPRVAVTGQRFTPCHANTHRRAAEAEAIGPFLARKSFAQRLRQARPTPTPNPRQTSSEA